jgi:membrane protein
MPTETSSAQTVVVPTKTVAPSTTHRNVLRRLAFMAWATVKAYFSDKIPQMGAALAFYTTVAVAPLLVLAVAVAQIVFKEDNARSRILGEIEQLAGPSASHALADVHPPAHAPGTATIATIVGVITLIVGAVAVFTHLQDALNTIWRSPPYTNENWREQLKRRLFSLGAVLTTGFILLVSLTLSAALTWLGENASHAIEGPAGVWETLNFLLTFGVITCLFAITFKLLPDVVVRWRDVWTGAVATALLFAAGKTVLGIYLAKSTVTSAYGAAGSAIALLLWCYYAAQILFLGAEFTRVHAWTNGGRKPLELTPPIPHVRRVRHHATAAGSTKVSVAPHHSP